MGRSARITLVVLGTLILIFIIAAVSIPMFLNTDSFRTRIESTLTKSLGRKVTIGKLDLSVWSGSLVAENATVADDPAFSSQPFIQADSVKIAVKILPLLFHRQILIRGFALKSPRIQLLRAANGTWNYSTISAASKSTAQDADTRQTFPDLTVGKIDVDNGQITVGPGPGVTGAAVSRTYQQVTLDVQDFGFTKSFPFSASAHLPAGGTLSISGKAGPINQQDASATPLDAHIDLKHFELGAAGILPPDAGIGGMADLQAQVQSDGQTLNAAGTTQIASIKLAKDGQPSTKPVQVQFNVSQNQLAKTGQIQQAVIKIGAAIINVAGTYQTSGPTTAIDLKVKGNAVPIDELEAFLPSLGVHLPPGSRLQGGTLTTALTVSGSTAAPVISGPVRLDNTQLAGFDLGSRLQSLSQLTGGRIGGATKSGTNIRSLSMVIQAQGGAIRTDKVLLDVAGVGTASGAGTISAAGALNYNVVLKLTELAGSSSGSKAAPASAGGISGIAGALAGFVPGGAAGGLGVIGNIAGAALKNGIPVAVGGTTSNPTFSPNLGKLASGIGAGGAQGLVKGKGRQPTQSNPLGNALGGLFGKH